MTTTNRLWTKIFRAVTCGAVCSMTILSHAGDTHSSEQASEGQKALAKAYVCAVNEKDIQKLKQCLHPKCVASINAENRDFFDEYFAREMKPSIPADYKVRVSPVREDQMKSMTGFGIFPITPTHMIHIEWFPEKNSTKGVGLYAVQDGGKWHNVMFAPTQQTLDRWRERKPAGPK